MHEPESRLSSDHAASSRKNLNPWLAAAILGTLILAVFAYAQFFLRERPRAAVPATDSALADPAYGLEDTEALDIFQDLDARRIALYRDPDSTQADTVFLPGTEIYRRVVSELDQLQEDGVSARPRLVTKDLRVISSALDHFRLRQVVISSARFFDETGGDVTKNRIKERRVIRWLVARKDGEWLISEAAITSAAEVP